MQGTGGKKSFGEYLKGLGLAEKPVKMTKAQRKKLTIRGLKTAQRILKMKIKKSKK